jgi:NitT/TauT family transport system substrate-binding protein
MTMRIDRKTFAAGLACAAFTPLRAAAQGTAMPATISVGCALDDQTTPLLYAQKAGLFAKAGLDVQIVRMSSGATIAAAVVGGTLQIGKASMLNLVSAHARGIPLTLVAPAAFYTSERPDGGLIATPALSVRSGADLNGKIIGVASLDDLNSIATQAWIDKNGGDAKTVKFVELSPAVTEAALGQGRVDGSTLWNPILTQAIASGHAHFAAPVFDAIAKRYQVAAWFAGTDWVGKNRALLDRFITVMHVANVYVAAHEAETTTLIAAFLGVDAAVLGKMARSTPAPYLSAREIDPVIALAAAYKKIPAAYSATEMISSAALTGAA